MLSVTGCQLVYLEPKLALGALRFNRSGYSPNTALAPSHMSFNEIMKIMA